MCCLIYKQCNNFNLIFRFEILNVFSRFMNMRFILITDSGNKFHMDFVYRSATFPWGLGGDWSKSGCVVIRHSPEARANSTAIRQTKTTALGLLAVGVVRGGSIRGSRYPRGGNRSECHCSECHRNRLYTKRTRQHDVTVVTPYMTTENRVSG